MTDHDTTAFSTRRKDKVRALLAGGLVLGIGAAFTLAAWTDNEWVFGGAGPDDDNPGTKTYAMEQNTVAPFASGTWTDEPVKTAGTWTSPLRLQASFPATLCTLPSSSVRRQALKR
ncbi:SipW-dependent-type signal peptide-containing protein [Arthrobacter sp. SA17]